MEELKIRLDEIKEEMSQLDHMTEVIERENSILEFFDKVHKEVM